MTACLSLEVVLGIPVRVIDDDCVCSGEVDTKTTGSSAEEEDKTIGIYEEEDESGVREEMARR